MDLHSPRVDTIAIMAGIVVFATLLSFFGSWRDRRNFRSYGYQRVMELLAGMPMTEEELLDRDSAISSNNVIGHHLWRMEKKKLLVSTQRGDGTTLFHLTERGRQELTRLLKPSVPLQKNTTEAA